MVWNVKIVARHPDTVSAHLVDQIFSKDNDFLTTILNPKGEGVGPGNKDNYTFDAQALPFLETI